MHERRLHVDCEQYAEPDKIDAKLVGDRPDQWNDDEREFKEVEEECQDENQDIDDDEEAELATRQAGEQMLDPDVTVDAIERQAEDARTHQYEDNERRQFGRGIH